MAHRFRHLPLAAMLALAATAMGPSAVLASSWQRRSLLRSPLNINLIHPDLRFLDSAAPGELSLWGGKLRVLAPGVDPETLAQIAPVIDSNLHAALDSWETASPSGEPIRLLILSAAGAPFSEVFSVAGAAGTERDPVVALNVAGQTDEEIGAETVRDVASFILRRLAPNAGDSLVFAAARALSIRGDLLDSDREEIRETGSSPVNSLDRPEGEIFAATWINEMAAAAGTGFVSSVWTRRIAGGNASLLAFAEGYSEAVHSSPWDAFQRALERDYSRTEVFGDLSRLTERDRAAGALDVSRPGPLAWRFYSSEMRSTGGLSVSWPPDAAAGFAVLHYEDSLPSDVVAFAPGDSRVLPLSGVSRVDWVIAGNGDEASSLAAPVTIAALPDFPVSGLAARAVSQPGQGVSLEWSTARQTDLSGWAIFRTEVNDSGKILQSAPQWLPSSGGEQEQSLYSFVDSTATPGLYYRYDVWAVTEDGALSRSFHATIRAR
ncbi:MAG: hypothetical protein ACRD16_15480 [Thermoanaerobaculia bacterium]